MFHLGYGVMPYQISYFFGAYGILALPFTISYDPEKFKCLKGTISEFFCQSIVHLENVSKRTR